MAEEYELNTLFQYRNNSNLVLHREGPVSNNEPTGEPETLVGRISHKMGDRVTFYKPNLDNVKAKKVSKRPKLDIDLTKSVLDFKNYQEYQPKSSKTRRVYQQLVSTVQKILGDQPFEVLYDSSNETISLLRNNSTIEDLKKLLPTVSQDDYSILLALSKELSDFDSVTVEPAVDSQGVSLIFDEDDDVINDLPKDEYGLIGAKDIVEYGYEVQEIAEDNLRPEQGSIQLIESGQRDEIDENKISILQIDSHWLQREINRLYNSPEKAMEIERDILSALQLDDIQECENRIVTIFNYENFDFCKKLLHNRWQIYYCTRLGQAQSDADSEAIKREMASTPHGQSVLQEISAAIGHRNQEDERTRNLRLEVASLKVQSIDQTSNEMDLDESVTHTVSLEKFEFAQGAQFMSNDKVVLPQGSEHEETKEYTKVTIAPPSKVDDPVKLKPISTLPPWAQQAFKAAKIESLNAIQSTVFDIAFRMYRENMLICAPTGAGKTNVAILAILNAIGEALGLTDETETIPLLGKPEFLIVYISPMKSLVTEQTLSFSKRLEGYGLVVEELTGDISLSRSQLESTHIVVTTPEKFDVVSRKTGNENLLERLRLVIIDEIHLLHDTRGPVLEAVVARLLRRVHKPRLVGLSATLPNYEHVARFLNVDMGKGLFYFGSHYRPVPLEQVYYGVKDKKAIKRFNTINEILYNEIVSEVGKSQILVFVHSRKETYRTAKFILDTALSRDNLSSLITESSSRDILASESKNANSHELVELLPFGLGIHHAGLDRNDRQLVEDLFADKHIQVLVSTATLAWGVNLPAHTVIIKGTQVFYPEKGEWSELCPLHVTQMLGRAGRPQYDTRGRGIIITDSSALQFYLSLNNQQLPIESQLISQLPNVLNAEIASRNISSFDDCIKFMHYTYLFIRLNTNFSVYVKEKEHELKTPDEALTVFVTSALSQLSQLGMIRYEPRSSLIEPTFLGIIASHYYLRPESVSTLSAHLKPEMADSDILRLFSLSYEFRYIPVRDQEAMELRLLMEKVPIPVRGSPSDPSAKIVILLQAFISRLKLDGYALVSEISFIRQNATRIFRAFFEIALRRGWAPIAEKSLYLSKCCEKQMWLTSCPLRQISYIPITLINKLERKDISFDQYYFLSSADLGELVKDHSLGDLLSKAIHAIPKLDLQVYVQPITRSRVSIELSVFPAFVWDTKTPIHHRNERFWLIVEDVDGQHILYSDLIQISQNDSEKTFTLPLPIPDVVPPNYYLKVISDRWMGSESCTTIPFNELVLPDAPDKHTQLLDLVPLPIGNVKSKVMKRYLELLRGIERLGVTRNCLHGIQTQIFDSLATSSESLLLCMPPLSGKQLCINLALINFLEQRTQENSIALICSPHKDLSASAFSTLFTALGWENSENVLGVLDGDFRNDVNKFFSNNIILGSPAHIEALFRRWKSRDIFQSIGLFIVDDIHLVSDPVLGHKLEVCISRLRFASTQLGLNIRIVGFSYPITNPNDIANWIGATKVYNFTTDSRRTPLALTIRSVDSPDRDERLASILKILNTSLLRCDTVEDNKKVLIFCSDAWDTRSTALELALKHSASGIVTTIVEENKVADRERTLSETLRSGVGFIDVFTHDHDVILQQILFTTDLINILVVDQSVIDKLRLFSPNVVVQDTKVLKPIFGSIELQHSSVGTAETDYSPLELLHLISYADTLSSLTEFFPTSLDTESLEKFGTTLSEHVHEWASSGHSTDPPSSMLFTLNSLKSFYTKGIFEAQPAESVLELGLEEHLLSEIVLGTVTSPQDAIDWLTWTLYYRRLFKNPNYYGLSNASFEHLSDHLSEVVENALANIEKMQLIETGDALSALNLGLVGSYYALECATLDLFNRSIEPSLTHRVIITIICAASEVQRIPLHRFEESLLNKIAYKLGIPIPRKTGHNQNSAFVNPHFKASLLIEAHMSRLPLPRSLEGGVQFILPLFLRLAHALVDVVSSNMWLAPALTLLETCQMVVQAVSEPGASLMQVPHLDEEACKALAENGVNDILQFLSMENLEDFVKRFTEEEQADIATACNSYPLLQVELDESLECECGESVVLNVKINRDNEAGLVVCPYLGFEKREEWWLVVGDAKENTLYGIKRLYGTMSDASVCFDAPSQQGVYRLTLYVVSDCYLGLDQEFEFALNVRESNE